MNLHYPLLTHVLSQILKSDPGHRYFQEEEEKRAGRQVSDILRYWGGMVWINLLISSETNAWSLRGVSGLLECFAAPHAF